MALNYTIGRTSFSSSILLNNGQLFRNPNELEIEMTSAGRFAVEVLRPDGQVAGSDHRDQFGWCTFSFRTGGAFGPGIPNEDYRIRLVNRGPGTRQARGGNLEYDV